jgi:hypothetical protein
MIDELTLTPYEKKVLANASKYSIGEENLDKRLLITISVLLDAIEQRDKLLQEYYKFFEGSSRRGDCHKILMALETP